MPQHLLAIDDVAEDFEKILRWGIEFKRLWKQSDEVAMNFMPLDSLAIGSIYEKPSTRTRVSFEVGINRLGGYPLTLLKNDIQLGKSETVGDTSQVLSRFLGGMTYRCFSHDDVAELAKHADVPVLNALSDKHHPCQAAADLMTVLEHFDEPSEITVAWVGDGNNVLHDLMLACAMLGIDINYAVPEGYEPAEDVVERTKVLAEANGSKVMMTHDPIEAVSGAHVVYTDVFISMGEEHMTDKVQAFDGYQVNEAMVGNMDSTWKFMHCLPAHRGDEVTDWVMDHKQSIVFDQAENRMWAQMSLLAYFINEGAWQAMGEFMGLD
ncbi:MAG: ornithine carbamoyltransferase [Euryarchaeota archaeon]|jgi:ornithine carbamoyltransferase|nr:MAG: ornithine carbamoyltransferase [uncultured Candidatus Poseidoniales archaeon]MBT3451973.1 ornithine carbamoyltransferase [Euryarchaeota archaeon]MDA8557876.1 ornithine carbamoyltransferase [Candidatus Poseidoniales archaeon]MDB0004998.1 ornithine carbamoyltransferase [Candidatus Poseidoniaceae archaeon]MBT5122608.1 ornithine carbamoyltransferase [Euryarchaeota archaeon]